mgnify:FL=1
MRVKSLILVLLFIFIASCANDKNKNVELIEKKEINLQMIDAYNEGLEKLNSGDGLSAAKKFSVEK